MGLPPQARSPRSDLQEKPLRPGREGMFQDQAGSTNGAHVLTDTCADNLDGMDLAGGAAGVHQGRDLLQVAVRDPAPEGAPEYHPLHIERVGDHGNCPGNEHGRLVDDGQGPGVSGISEVALLREALLHLSSAGVLSRAVKNACLDGLGHQNLRDGR
jgi:hypothetical protein